MSEQKVLNSLCGEYPQWFIAGFRVLTSMNDDQHVIYYARKINGTRRIFVISDDVASGLLELTEKLFEIDRT